MKLTRNTLKSLIKEVMVENKKNSTILFEEMEELEGNLPSSQTFERIMDILLGKDESVRTVAIMSGQNPMAQPTDEAQNSALDASLRQDISAMGLQFIRCGGKFEGILESSVVILNPSREQAQELNRKYKQWGYVWGQDLPAFQMIQVDYKNSTGDFVAPGSRTATAVDASAQAQKATDNYSFDLESGRKFIIALY